MRLATLISAGVLATLCLVPASAQPPQQRQAGPRGGGGQQGMNQRGNQNRAADATQVVNQNGMNQNAMNQNGQQMNQRPTAEQLAQMMLANFDTDGSGNLDQLELQSALTAMTQQMQHQRSRQGSQMNQFMQRGSSNQPGLQTRDQRSGPPQRGGGGRSSGRQSRR